MGLSLSFRSHNVIVKRCFCRPQKSRISFRWSMNNLFLQAAVPRGAFSFLLGPSSPLSAQWWSLEWHSPGIRTPALKSKAWGCLWRYQFEPLLVTTSQFLFSVILRYFYFWEFDLIWRHGDLWKGFTGEEVGRMDWLGRGKVICDWGLRRAVQQPWVRRGGLVPRDGEMKTSR